MSGRWNVKVDDVPASWVHPQWHVVGTGDFNSDSFGDLLLRHEDGWLVQWLNDGDGSFSDNSAAIRWLHPDWHIAGTGDFDKDGKDDLLMRHQDGWMVEWLGQADGSFAENSAANIWLHPAWLIRGIGDYDGDGHHDLLLRHADATVTTLLGGEGGIFFDNGEVGTSQVSWAYTTRGFLGARAGLTRCFRNSCAFGCGVCRLRVESSHYANVQNGWKADIGERRSERSKWRWLRISCRQPRSGVSHARLETAQCPATYYVEWRAPSALNLWSHLGIRRGAPAYRGVTQAKSGRAPGRSTSSKEFSNDRHRQSSGEPTSQCAGPDGLRSE